MLYQSIILAVMAAPTIASVPQDNDIVSGLSFDVFKAPIDAGGARGYFGMKITDSLAIYNWNIDVRNFNTTCDISDGLVYHIHSYWNDAETSSTTTCGDTGGHYDPYFACGKASQSASTDCASLGRTLSQGFEYPCSPDKYSAGDLSACEVGDLSTKFGKAAVENGFARGYVRDPVPPIATNFQTATTNSEQWSSIVFHCPGKIGKIDKSMEILGDLVLFDKGSKVKPKMAHRYLGPYRVKHHVANDVTCQHLATGEVKKYDVLDLKLYAGNEEDAFNMAARDQDQHVIDKIIYHYGDRMLRTTLTFKIKYKAGDTHWVPYSKDLFDSIPYEEYCDAKPYLRHLKYTTQASKKFIQDINKRPLTGFNINQKVYLDIRIYGDGWFNKLNLPDSETNTYVSEFRLTACTKKKLTMINTITSDTHELGSYEVYCFVHPDFKSAHMVRIDEAFMVKYPQVTQD